MKKRILEIKNLSISFPGGDSGRDKIMAVENLSLEVFEGEILGIVGESGSGKTVTAFSVLGLVQEPPGNTESGEILYRGADLRKLPFAEMRNYRGKEISMIFQEPASALNPVMTIKSQIYETLSSHGIYGKKEIQGKALELLKSTGISDTEKRINEYPGSLSGGMQQRVMIAMALACNPSLLIADEPTTSLDVTVQAQILDLIRELKDTDKISSVILITHNMGIIAEMCDRVAVMYRGRILESAPVKNIFENPLNPYTKGLLDSTPVLGRTGSRDLKPLPADVSDNQKGCRFYGRCGFKKDICGITEPELKEHSGEHFVRCHLYE